MVNRLFDFIPNLWIRVRVGAPPFVQRTAIPRLHEVKEIVRLLARPYLPVYQLQGQGQGGPLTVTYIGLEYAKPALKTIFFVENPVEQRVGQIPFWHYDELANLSSSDIIIIHAAKHLIHKLPRQNAIILPHYVHHILDVRGDWQDVRLRFRKNTRKYLLRLIRKYGYEYDLSSDSQDFEKFYHQMYLPTMDNRHGELSTPMSVREAFQYFRHGWLFRIMRDGAWVSGIICHPQENILLADIVGVINADTQLIDEGATVAAHHAAIHWANQHGYSAVNLLGTGPYMGEGRFHHKRRWGTAISVPPHLHRQIWIRVCRITPAISKFLKETPFVVVDEEERLHGLITVDDVHDVSDETKKIWEKDYVTPGLSSLLIRSVGDFVKEPSNSNNSDLVIPIPLSSNAKSEK